MLAEALRVAQRADALAAEMDVRVNRFRPRPLREIVEASPPSWLVHGVLPSVGVAELFAPPGAGKTFAALDLAASIARGLPWFDRKTRPGAVLFVAAEGSPGLRLRGYMAAHGVGFPELEDLHVLTQAPNLLDGSDLRDVLEAAREIPDLRLIVADTLARCTDGIAENETEFGKGAVAAADRLAKTLSCCVLLTHHPAKSAGAGPRGSGALLGGLDTLLEVERAGDVRTLWIRKQREGEDEIGIGSFTLRQIDLGTDDQGEPVTSCVIEPTEASDRPAKSKSPLPHSARVLLDVIHGLLSDPDARVVAGLAQIEHGAKLGHFAVPVESARAAFYAARSDLSEASLRKTFSRAVETLMGRRELSQHEGVLWIG